ncbi:hypothetical protein UlMin_040976 [Ulmus minor]
METHHLRHRQVEVKVKENYFLHLPCSLAEKLVEGTKYDTRRSNPNLCRQQVSYCVSQESGVGPRPNGENCHPLLSWFATDGGAYKFADLIKEKLGISLCKEDEMDCLVAGANFLLKTLHQEAYTYMNDTKEFVEIGHDDLYLYLLVNIGSGVSIIKVDGPGKFEQVGGTSVGGGTFWGLGIFIFYLNFDDLLELSHHGNNIVIDMLVGDIYHYKKNDFYLHINMYVTFLVSHKTLPILTATTIASSFGKPISDNKELKDYKPEDIAYLNALQFGFKRIFFGGFFIQGHEYTMDTISIAINFCLKLCFLRHEGFLGALGAFASYEKQGFDDLTVRQLVQQSPISVKYNIHGPLYGDLNENETIECSVYVSSNSHNSSFIGL